MKYLAILALLAACDDSDGVYGAGQPDARAADSQVDAPAVAETLCGQPLPMIAPSSIQLTGTVAIATSTGSSTEPGIVVELRKRNGSAPLASGVTADAGAFKIIANTAGVPVDGYLHASRAGDVPLYFFPTAPFAQDTPQIILPLVDTALLGTLYPSGSPQPNTGILAIAMRGCTMNTFVSGASVAVNPPGSSVVRYVDDHGNLKPSPDSTTVDAVVTDVPAGEVTITTFNGSQTLRTGRVKAFANSMSMVDLYPQ